ncbi:MAG TPA: glycosyltransferase family 39 protein, partial [Bryobacteraceae bacterium]
NAIYRPRAELYAIHLGRSHVPIMLMTYLGALKSLIYKPIFTVFGTGIFALRVPMLLAGTVSVWLFFLLLRRIAGERAALIGCALLAVDSIYLTTVCFDWGPVAIQHLAMVGGALLLVRFYQQDGHSTHGGHWALAGGFFLLGLAMWDKALAIWTLSGMAIAGILTLPRQIFNATTRRRVGVALLAFTLGALPLLIYNAKNHWGTFHGNLTRDTAGIPGKARFLMESENRGLFGWLTAVNWQTPEPHVPHGALETASARISAVAGEPHNFPLLYAFGLALLLTPLAGRNGIRAILFALITMAVAWIQMAINANTGGSIHHTVLLWPIPELIIAISFAAASRRLGRAGIPALAVVMAVMLTSGVLVINQYHVEMLRYGGAQAWNNSIFALSDYIKGVPARNVVCLDWGIMDPLRMLHRGRLPLLWGSDLTSKPEMTADDRAGALAILSQPDNVYIAHTKAFEFFPGVSPRLVEFAGQAGYRRTVLATISDTYGRPVYEVYRFSAATPLLRSEPRP